MSRYQAFDPNTDERQCNNCLNNYWTTELAYLKNTTCRRCKRETKKAILGYITCWTCREEFYTSGGGNLICRNCSDKAW